MESPETAASMAWAMVLQAVVGDVQLLPSKPLTPSTYQVVATAAGANAAAIAVRSKALSSLYFMIFLRFHKRLPCKCCILNLSSQDKGRLAPQGRTLRNFTC